MITLKTNNIPYKIPTIHELDVATFAKLQGFGDFTIIDYLSIVLDIDFKTASDFRIKNPIFLSNQLYGDFPDYESQKPRKFITVKGKRYNLNPNFTLGQRFIIEENGKGKDGLELLLFMLAVNADQDNYSELLELINKEQASRIIPEAFFLLGNLSNGRSLEQMFLRVFKRWMKMLN